MVPSSSGNVDLFLQELPSHNQDKPHQTTNHHLILIQFMKYFELSNKDYQYSLLNDY